MISYVIFIEQHYNRRIPFWFYLLSFNLLNLLRGEIMKKIFLLDLCIHHFNNGNYEEMLKCIKKYESLFNEHPFKR